LDPRDLPGRRTGRHHPRPAPAFFHSLSLRGIAAHDRGRPHFSRHSAVEAWSNCVRHIRIGAGAGYSGDRIDPAVELAAKGSIAYLVFECLAERTIALAQKARRLDPAAGFDPLLEERMEAVLPLCLENGI